MNSINRQNSTAKNLMVIGLLGLFVIVIPVGFIGVLVYFDLAYTVPTALAITAFTVSVILAIRQKRINIYSVAAVIVGLLFLASSIIEFSFGAFTQNMSINDQINFSGLIRPNRVSHGLSSIGVGLASILVNFGNIKNKNLSIDSLQIQKYKSLRVFQLGGGIFLFLFGIYIFINGLQPL